MNKLVTVKDVIQLFERWVPQQVAESWDNVGLQVGKEEQTVRKIMITLDVVESVVDEAIEKEVDFIISHHPLFFQKLQQLDLSSPKGKIVEKLIRHDISVYAAHTNLDVVQGGVNDMLIDRLQLTDCHVLVPTNTEQLLKLVIYVPQTHVNQLTKAVGDAGAGHIGDYSHCTFRTSGTGAFQPLEGTNPYVGQQGEIEEVEEYRMETVIKHSEQTTVLQAAEQAHPYEEMAYDLFPLAIEGESIGLGRIGRVHQSMTLREYANFVKEVLDVPQLRIVGDPNATIETVAVLGGSGKGFISQAAEAGADVYITGDLTFHEAQDAEEAGIHLIDPGHHVEKVMKQGVQAFFDKHKDKLGETEVIVSEQSTEPFRFQ
ncbi:hypothetical protein J416_05758 [Gracilibacillus halophilus YIM-C55.5]|uniref:GTP cyclohydrolase 1 type 2 homolog n=1 Tax=Gracilibacillus halophilus YIM-C55.5 TaxID=1308866 RepID=N4WMX1_9BACI|nr:Nif3-like dinuclear metal center hexameric protein [Gracilibacillus halophilus]ENH97492.1 hypothetical protein J416_05758 [Gracilibacillus halophilus YIM-C55.5]